MNEHTVTILDKLNLYYDDEAYCTRFKHSISYGELIDALLFHTNIGEAAIALGISLSTIERNLPTILGTLVPKIPTSPWGFSLLLFINKKSCTSCNSIRNTEDFSIRLTDRLRTSCKYCERDSVKFYNEVNPEKRKEYYTVNMDKFLVYGKQYYLKHRDSQLSTKRLYAETHPWIGAFKSAKRRAIKKLASPSWANLDLIREIYKNRPEGYHIDHIIPLIHTKVCGLHVHNNLQPLTVTDNLSKSNTWISDWDLDDIKKDLDSKK